MDRDSRDRRKVDSVIEEWRAGATPNAREAIRNLPEAQEHRSVSIDLAYEEYCLRKEAGQDIDTQEFCKQFPTIQNSLIRMLDVHRCLQSFSLQLPTERVSDWPKVGDRWLDWRLIDVIGRGAFSRVYLAEEPSLGNRQVVVKCSHAGPKEAYILGRLAHPNIVPVHSIRVDDDRGMTAICMPLLGSMTLAALLDELRVDGQFRPLSSENEGRGVTAKSPLSSLASTSPDDYIAKVTYLVEQVAQGLAAAHDRGIVHGDIKPSNILISYDGKPMLVDFNLAIDDGHGGQLGGTPPYMAPECFRGLATPVLSDGVAATKRSDQFSLGVVLFELLTGALPYELDFSATKPTYRDARSEATTRPTGILIEPELLQIVNRCLSPESEDRFETINDLVRQLRAVRQKVERRQPRRRFVRCVLLASLLLAVAASFGSAVLVVSRESPSQQQLRSALNNMKNGDFFTAAQQLGYLNQKHRSPNLAAWTAYCHAKNGSYETARAFNGFALKEKDDRSGRIWNNLGLSNAQLGHLVEAEKEFSTAIEKNPDLQAPYINRARLRLRMAMQDGMPLTKEDTDDLKRAFANGLESAELHFLAASMFAYPMTQGLPADKETIENHTVRALQLGEPVQNFEKSHLFNELEIDELLKRAQPISEPAPTEAEVLLTPPLPLEDELLRLAD